MKKVFADYHTHTVYSHGKGTPEQNVLAAMDAGLSKIAISEHASSHLLYGVRGERLFALRKEIDALNKKYGNKIEVLMGLECNLTAFGKCDAPKDTSMFDVLLLGYHRCIFPRDGYALRSLGEAFNLTKGDSLYSANAILAAAEKYKINILSHPSEYVKQDIAVLAKGAAQLNVALELNCRHLSMNDEEILCAAKHGARFVIGSDAHKPCEIGKYKNSLTATERLGVEERVDNII
ncbi:MAG: PHP domain-containing protein [Clostridia bacterium]|nr:PHP domain-containing protein [Clostridia bacterium]